MAGQTQRLGAKTLNEAYEAAKARLVRKYTGGVGGQIQCNLDVLLKMKRLREDSAKDLEKFADVGACSYQSTGEWSRRRFASWNIVHHNSRDIT